MQTQALIIGGGPAGIACAIWLNKLGVACTLFEAAPRLGGLQTLSPYENLWIPGVQGRTGQEVAADLAGHAMELGVDVRLDAPVTQVLPGYRIGDIEAPFVVIATGTRPRAGGFKASADVAIGPGTPMEAMPVAGRRIAILGGGDNAFDQARFVRDRGGHVTVFSRSSPRAQTLLQAMIPDVPIIAGPYIADQGAMTVNGEAFDAFGVMYGFEAVVPPGLDPAMEGGYVAVNRQGETSLPGVYACGEVTDYWHPCVSTAIAHGVQVAKQISLKIAHGGR
ncbi:MAG: NAD(P)/FAD-dependent oxidoreductase [Asticcacaulis sp.]